MKVTIELDNDPFQKQDSKDCLEALVEYVSEMGMDASDAPVMFAIITELQRLNPK